MSDVRVPVAEFVTSAADAGGWPSEDLAEVAVAGRSNVGKSSLLNSLCERRGLVRTSSTPGRTRLVNFFRVEALVDGARRPLMLVDLPGFGYAKVSKSERATWRPTIEQYLAGRSVLRAALLLVDARRGAELDERELGPWIAQRGVTLIPVMTKSDKLAKHERRLAADALARELGARPVVFSATTGEGRDALWRRILATLDGSAAR